MANVKKTEQEKRIMRAYTIKKGVAVEFSNHCKLNNISASRLVEDFIINYLKL